MVEDDVVADDEVVEDDVVVDDEVVEDVEVVAEDEVVVDDVVVDDEVVVDEVVEEDITGVGSLATLTSPAPTPAHAEASDARASRADTFRRQNADLTHATVHRYAVAATS